MALNCAIFLAQVSDLFAELLLDLGVNRYRK